MLYFLTVLLGVGVCIATQKVLDGIEDTQASLWDTKTPGSGSFMSGDCSSVGEERVGQPPIVDLDWFPPSQTAINDLSAILNGKGVFGFIFDGSDTPADAYGTYNWCNMPRNRAKEYVKAPEAYRLEYVEVIHRHHKRTPYASNTFPQEDDTWYCDDESLFHYGVPEPEGGAAICWQAYKSTVNPFRPRGFNGTCQFPQITKSGLLDSRQHGRDLFELYHDVLKFLPDQIDTSRVSFRVTNNQITSQVAGQVIFGMYEATNHETTRVLVQPRSIDSLEPTYRCPSAEALYSGFGVGSSHAKWTRHLTAQQTIELLARLDAVSGIEESYDDWYESFDHYFDNLSARMCHQKRLPCNVDDPSMCVSKSDVEAVLRRGEYEYSYLYRDSAALFAASVATYGVWMAELAANLRRAMAGTDKMIYRHNVAHDGSISRLLSFLQVDVMMWPGMGSEVVFELYSHISGWYLRVFWSGRILMSSNPSLDMMDLIPVETFLAYVDGLVGVNAENVPSLCGLDN